MSLGPNFRKLFAASAVSNLGDGIVYAAVPLLAAALTRDPFLVALAWLFRDLPGVLFSLVSGALVDRWDRRRVMSAANFARSGAIGTLSAAVLFDFASLSLLYATLFVIGACETFFDNASQTMVPSVVDRTRLDTANGRLESARRIADDLLGPPVGGFLFALGAAVPFLLNAGAFAAAAVMILALRGNFRSRKETVAGTTLLGETGAGVGWLFRHRLLGPLALVTAGVGFMDNATFSVFVLYAQEIIGLGAAGFGALLAVSAVGGVAGSLVVDRIVAFLGSRNTVLLALSLGAISYAGIALSDNALVVGALLLLDGLFLVFWAVPTLSLRQSLVPEGMLGRVNSAYRFLLSLGTAVGSVAGGVVASQFGLVAPFWLGAVSLCAMGAATFFAFGRRGG